MKNLLVILILNICVTNIYAQGGILFNHVQLAKNRYSTMPVDWNNSILGNTGNRTAYKNYLLNDIELSFGYLVIPYLANDAYVPSITISYYHLINKWFWLGVLFNFNYVTPFSEQINMEIANNSSSQVVVEPEKKYEYFGIAPVVRFSYVNKPNFLLYSGLALGLQTYYNERKLSIASVPYFQTTWLGFSYGKNLYIGGEIGAGFKGILNVNAGYKF